MRQAMIGSHAVTAERGQKGTGEGNITALCLIRGAARSLLHLRFLKPWYKNTPTRIDTLQKRTRSSYSRLKFDLRWVVTPNLHNGLPRPLTHNCTNIPDISDLPNTLRRFSQISNILSRLRLEQPDPPVVPTSHEEVLVEL